MIAGHIPLFSRSADAHGEEFVRMVSFQYSSEIRNSDELRKFIRRFNQHLMQEASFDELESVLDLSPSEIERIAETIQRAQRDQCQDVGPAPNRVITAPLEEPSNDAQTLECYDSWLGAIQIIEEERAVIFKSVRFDFDNEDCWIYFTEVVRARGNWITSTKMTDAYNKRHPNHRRIEKLNVTKARKPLKKPLRDLIETPNDKKRNYLGARLKCA